MESEVRHLLRVSYRPAPAALSEGRPEPVYLQVCNDVHGPALRRGLNSHLAGVPVLAGDKACRHCCPVGMLKISEATVSGSLADRVGWLFLGGYRVPLRSDSDFLLEMALSQTPLRAEADAGRSEPCLAPSEVPGYYRVLLGRRLSCRHRLRRELAAGAVREALSEAVRLYRPDRSPPRISGPAVSFSDSHSRVDCVPCVPVHGDTVLPWLSELRERPRPSGWPDDRLLSRLDDSLLVVPVGPRADDHRLWRLSFSRPEAALVRELPPRARYCLMLLRAVRAGRRQLLGSVSSYYLKTCVLWQCQEQPASQWQDTLAAMCAVLDMLQRAVGDRFLPCFFCRKINVFRDTTEENLANIRTELCYFQENLLCLLHAMLTSLKLSDPIKF